MEAASHPSVGQSWGFPSLALPIDRCYYSLSVNGRRHIVPKTVEVELSEADRMHALAVKMRAQKDSASADALEAKVRAKRRRAIARMGRKVGSGSKKPTVV